MTREEEEEEEEVGWLKSSLKGDQSASSYNFDGYKKCPKIFFAKFFNLNLRLWLAHATDVEKAIKI